MESNLLGGAVDIVLGVSMAPTTVRMVLVEGENADGATVDEDDFEVAAAGGSATSSAPDRVLAAILGTRESAAEGNFQLTSTGVTWTDPHEAAALRDALAAHKVENVMLVSAFLAAAALAQAAGSAVGYAYTGLLFLEPDIATLAVVDSADGSIFDVRRQPMHGAHASVDVADMVAWLSALESPLDGVFIVGCGVDTARIKSQVEMATALPVSGPDTPTLALARGAALASANAPLFISSTAALAYAQVPDWTTAGVVDSIAVTPGTADAGSVDQGLGYDAVAEPAIHIDEVEAGHGRKPFLVALGVMTIFFVGVLALVISLAISIRPTADRQPSATGNLIVPAKQASAPASNGAVQAPPPALPLQGPSQVAREVQPAPPAIVPAPAPAAPATPPAVAVTAPAPPVVAVAPVAPAPAAPVPVPIPEAPAPAPAPEAPAPVPVAPAPIPLPVEVPGLPILPQIFNPPVQESPNPGGGEHHAGGWPGGGDGGWPGGGQGGDGGFGGDHGGFGGFGGDHGGFGGFGGDHGGFGGGHGGFGGERGGGFGGHGGGHR
jgi:hypothetical protein